MTERALNLKPYQVRAALAGRLRRVMRPVVPEPEDRCDLVPHPLCVKYPGSYVGLWAEDTASAWQLEDGEAHTWRNPFGTAGAALWGRETFRGVEIDGQWCVQYKAGGFLEDIPDEYDWRPRLPTTVAQVRAFEKDEEEPWRPSTQLPRKLSRLSFTVTATGVVRLGECVDFCSDCGIQWQHKDVGVYPIPGELKEQGYGEITARFADQWNNDNPKRPWAPERWAWWTEVEVKGDE